MKRNANNEKYRKVKGLKTKFLPDDIFNLTVKIEYVFSVSTCFFGYFFQ